MALPPSGRAQAPRRARGGALRPRRGCRSTCAAHGSHTRAARSSSTCSIPHGAAPRTHGRLRPRSEVRLRRLEMTEDSRRSCQAHRRGARAGAERAPDARQHDPDDRRSAGHRQAGHHKVQTPTHAERMRQRLSAHGATPSMVRQAAGSRRAREDAARPHPRRERGPERTRRVRGRASRGRELRAPDAVAVRAGDEETAAIARETSATSARWRPASSALGSLRAASRRERRRHRRLTGELPQPRPRRRVV